MGANEVIDYCKAIWRTASERKKFNVVFDYVGAEVQGQSVR